MYYIIRTKAFEKSYRKIKNSGILKPSVLDSFKEAVSLISEGKQLPSGYNDHKLHGSMGRYRECHIKGDLLLVYQIKNEQLLLILVDIGTHSYLNF